MKKSQKAQRAIYFERHKYECCKSTFQNAEHVIKTMRDTNAVLIDAYYDRYPFEEYAQNYIRYVLAFMRISENQAEYQECVSAGELAYIEKFHLEGYAASLWIFYLKTTTLYFPTELAAY